MVPLVFPTLCTVVTEVDRPAGIVPHNLPGTNDDIYWFSRRYKIPMNVINSGAASMYPEIRFQIPKSLGGFGPEVPPTPAAPARRPVAK